MCTEVEVRKTIACGVQTTQKLTSAYVSNSNVLCLTKSKDGFVLEVNAVVAFRPLFSVRKLWKRRPKLWRLSDSSR